MSKIVQKWKKMALKIGKNFVKNTWSIVKVDLKYVIIAWNCVKNW